MNRSTNRGTKAEPNSSTPWAWSVGLVLLIGLSPLVAAFVGELLARAMGCEISFPQVGTCSRGFEFGRSLAMWLMAMIRWAIITVPTCVITLVGLAIAFGIMKKREQKA